MKNHILILIEVFEREAIRRAYRRDSLFESIGVINLFRNNYSTVSLNFNDRARTVASLSFKNSDELIHVHSFFTCLGYWQRKENMWLYSGELLDANEFIAVFFAFATLR